jgi:hypothetical protein
MFYGAYHYIVPAKYQPGAYLLIDQSQLPAACSYVNYVLFEMIYVVYL